jgi:hypothetical protein
MWASEAGDVDLMKGPKKTINKKHSAQVVPECL